MILSATVLVLSYWGRHYIEELILNITVFFVNVWETI